MKESGIDTGPIDGIMGARTQSAIKTYQRKNGLPETGRLDFETKRSLGLSAIEEGGEMASPDRRLDHLMVTQAKTPPAGSNIPPVEKSESKTPVSDVIMPVSGENGVLSHLTRAQEVRIDKGICPDGNLDENRLRLATIVGMLVISGLGLAALRPVGWVVLTGGGLMAVVLMSHWIGGYFNTIAYGVFTCAYVSPVLYRLVSKAWDMALIFALLLGTPVLLISNYAFGFDWWAAGCYGFAGMTLLPEGYRRIFSKRRYRPPYGTLYYRF